MLLAPTFLLACFLSAVSARPSALHKRAISLTVGLTTDTPIVSSIGDITLTASVTNTGDEDVKIIKYGSVLDSTLPTSSFHVTNANGEAVPFVGMLVTLDRYNLTDADLILLPKGETVTAIHTNIASAYDFSASGPGVFTFTPKAVLQVANAVTEVDEVSDTVTVIPSNELPTVSVEVTHDVARRHLEQKRLVLQCANAQYGEFLRAAYAESYELATLSIAYILEYGDTDPFYQLYFGNAPAEYPLYVFGNVAMENSTTRGVYCSDPYDGCDPGVLAYTLVSTTDIYYCPRGFQDRPTAALCGPLGSEERLVRGGTMLHELTHATSGTDDHGYGCDFDRALAATEDWEFAVTNADTYNCFSTYLYEHLVCETPPPRRL